MQADRRRQRILRDRLLVTLAMQAEGIAMQRENLRRRHPGASAAELDRRLREWLLDRPMDAPGRLVSWPRTRRRR
jgi:hypothetical protein